MGPKSKQTYESGIHQELLKRDSLWEKKNTIYFARNLYAFASLAIFHKHSYNKDSAVDVHLF